MRFAHKGYMSFIESNREMGRLKEIIKAILGSHAGRQHQDGLSMDLFKGNNDEVIGDPEKEHEVWTDHFTDFYKTSPEFDNDHRTEDWEPIGANGDRFLTSLSPPLFLCGTWKSFLNPYRRNHRLPKCKSTSQYHWRSHRP